MPGVESLATDFSSPDNPLAITDSLELAIPKEKCAIVGLVSFTGRDVGEDLAIALRRMHNRGQEGTGIAIYNPTVESPFRVARFDGKPTDVWADPEAVLEQFDLNGAVGIGQDRYVTSGRGDSSRFHQPFMATHNGRTMVLAHNGNIPLEYLAKLREELPDNVIPEADTDSEILALRIASADGETWEDKIRNGLTGVVGAYSLTIATDAGELFGIRDPFGIRPLVYADTEDGAVIASETNGIDEMVTFSRRQIEPGEMVRITKDGAVDFKRLFEERAQRHCINEGVYLSHRNSKRDDDSFYSMRYSMGQALASEKMVGLDSIIVGVPGSATEIAAGYAEALGRAQNQDLLRIRDKDEVTRSFMMDDEVEREMLLATKFTVSEEVSGREIVLVDDSIIRGGTTRVIVNALREKGASKITVLSASPRFIDVCDLGLDIAGQDELIALKLDENGEYVERTNQEIAEQIGADEVYYLSLGALVEAQNGKIDEFCTHCLTSEHPYDIDPKELINATTPVTVFEAVAQV